MTLFGLVGGLIIFLSTPLYQADALIMIGKNNVAGFTARRFMERASPMEEYFNTQYRLLGTRSIAETVIKDLKLAENPEFVGDKKKFSLSKLTDFVSEYFGGSKKLKPISSKSSADPNYQVIQEFSNRLILTPLPNSSLVRVSFRGESPVLVAQIANSIAEAFISMNIKQMNSGMGASGEWMRARLDELKEKMNKSQAEMSAYRKSTQVIEFEKNRNILTENLKGTNNESRKVQGEILKFKTIKEQLEKMEGDPIQILKSLPDSVKSQNINDLLKRYSEVKTEYDNSSKVYENSHPQMQAMTKELNNIESSIPDEIKLLIESLVIKIENAEKRKVSLKEALEREKKEMMDLENQKIRYDSLKMEYDTNSKLYNDLLLRMKEVEISAKNNQGEAEIVDRAQVPQDPIKPKKMLIMSVFLFLGMIGGSALVVRLEKYNKTIKFVEDVEKDFPFPVIGAVSVGEADEIPLPIQNRNSVIAEEFRKMRTRLMLSGYDGSNKIGAKKILMISSTEPDEGKSMISTNLSIAFTQIGKRVLIIDTDFSKPTVHNNLNAELEPGLLDYLRGEGDADQLIQETNIENLSVLTVGAMKDDFEDNFKLENLKNLFKSLKKKFDIIIVDTPPALTYSYVPIIAQASNGVLYVIKAGRKNTKMINRSFGNLLPSAQKKMQKNISGASQSVKMMEYFMNNYKIVGIVLNKAQYKTDDYYEYYRKYSKDYYNYKNQVNVE